HIQLANESCPLALFSYSTYDSGNFSSFWSQYSFVPSPTDEEQYTKPNVSAANPQAVMWYATMDGLYQRPTNGHGCDILAHLAMPSGPHMVYGAPEEVWISLTVNSTTKLPSLLVQFTLVEKPPSSLPEAMWVTFPPAATSVVMDKLGFPV